MNVDRGPEARRKDGERGPEPRRKDEERGPEPRRKDGERGPEPRRKDGGSILGVKPGVDDMSPPHAFAVTAATGATETAAKEWARRLGAPLSLGAAGKGHGGLVLEVGPAGLALLAPGGARVVAAVAELLAPTRPGRDLLARAALSRTPGGAPSVVDATAGLGADGFHLASLGHPVVMLERESLLGALLEDAIARAMAGQFGRAAADSARRVTLHVTDARDYLAAGEPAGIVYLDPMFPEASKAALPNKGMATLRAHLEHGTGAAAGEEAELLEAARAFARRRVVVKRPLRAGALGGQEPSGSLRGRTVRYDLYAPAPG